MSDWIYENLPTTFLLCLLVALIIIFGIAYTIERTSCSRLDSMNPTYTFHWDMLTGCRVWVNGFWVDADDVVHILLDR
jgi:short subunit fatty acids transporter